MHDLDPVFSAFSRHPHLAALAKGLFRDPRLLQSMFIFKPPRIGGEVSWHQDSTYLVTEPLSVIGFWFALEDATVENGGMMAIQGGHKGPAQEPLPPQGRDADHRDARPDALSGRPKVALTARKARWWCCTGLLPHWSGPNRSDRSRHAYTLHVIDGPRAISPTTGCRAAPRLPLRGFLIRNRASPRAVPRRRTASARSACRAHCRSSPGRERTARPAVTDVARKPGSPAR
jgi:phytanoyl-CoA hydroxylase